MWVTWVSVSIANASIACGNAMPYGSAIWVRIGGSGCEVRSQNTVKSLILVPQPDVFIVSMPMPSDITGFFCTKKPGGSLVT